ncbi:MAG: PSP1 C-terminal domain-containing protein, partial [Wujia sp.]
MKEVIGVRFRENGKIYFFNPLNYKVDVGRHVIVETARGVEYGKVVLGRREIDEGKMSSPLKPIIRIADENDDAKYAENKEKSKKAYEICLEKIHKHGLEMKLIDA